MSFTRAILRLAFCFGEFPTKCEKISACSNKYSKRFSCFGLSFRLTGCFFETMHKIIFQKMRGKMPSFSQFMHSMRNSKANKKKHLLDFHSHRQLDHHLYPSLQPCFHPKKSLESKIQIILNNFVIFFCD